ncbi:MAG: flagellar hook-basal body protein [Clostridiales bacterium]|nr:flagellar hook-basal body protein [Clostridiales bacterium]
MKPSFYSGASGLIAYQNDMNNIGNNIANSNTVGYKPTTVSFGDLLYTEMYVNTPEDPLTGHGVRTLYTGVDTRQGNLVSGESNLDLAIIGKGWFSVEKDGERLYTRDGSFSISLQGDMAYLVSNSGAYVLDSEGQRIAEQINADTTELDYNAMTDKVGVFSFLYPEALTPISSNSYMQNEFTGEAAALTEGQFQLKKGYLEQSGISLADEMTNLIKAQRSYQLSARVVQTSDEIEQTVNSLRK